MDGDGWSEANEAWAAEKKARAEADACFELLRDLRSGWLGRLGVAQDRLVVEAFITKHRPQLARALGITRGP